MDASQSGSPVTGCHSKSHETRWVLDHDDGAYDDGNDDVYDDGGGDDDFEDAKEQRAICITMERNSLTNSKRNSEAPPHP